jgi:asparagine synthase (glutamine-hydrolysing)
MCGIAGYAGVDEPPILLRMADAMSHRGPDDSGVWWDSAERVGLAHRRLSVIDLSSAGHQPMSVDEGDLCISYNGEIYNFQDHRRRLEAGGIAFRSRTDTEVLLRLYQERGLDALQALNGMFAFALWDRPNRRMLLARDHAGIKPLYYVVQGHAIYFASEIKALLSGPAIPNSLNERALASYMTFLWVPGSETLMRGIRKLEPGHYLLWEQGRIAIRPWFELSYEPEYGRTATEWVDEVKAAVVGATRRQLVADVPLGAFLSGGLDSSSLVASMRTLFPDRGIRTYTIRSPAGDMAAEQGTDDYPYARRVAEALGVELKTVDIEPDVTRLLPRMVYHLDEPDADPAVFPTYLISKLAREDGTTVLLSGTGGDEVFFGYRSHQAFKLANQLRMLAPALGVVSGFAAAMAAPILGSQHRITRRLGKLGRGLSAPNRLARHLAIVDWSSPVERRALLGAVDEAQSVDRAGFGHYEQLFRGHGDLNFHSHLLINTFLAAHNFLYTDKASMAASLEVRVPFMDLELMRLAARIPEGFKLRGMTTKYVLKKAMESFLPKDVIYRPKTGFGAPLRRWIRKDLRPLIRAMLGPDALRRRGLFNPEAVARILAENDAGRADHAYLIYALLTLEIWMQTFIDHRAKCLAT